MKLQCLVTERVDQSRRRTRQFAVYPPHVVARLDVPGFLGSGARQLSARERYPSSWSRAAVPNKLRIAARQVRNAMAFRGFEHTYTKEDAMDWNRVEGNWKQVKGKMKEHWGKLTDDDLDVINGKQDQLEGRLQQRYGYAKDQAKKEVNDWYDRQKW